MTILSHIAVTAQPLSHCETADTLRARNYNKATPLIYEDAYDLWPYAYRTENGEEMGYNIDLLTALMEKLNIPYVVVLKKRSDVLNDLKDGRADLTFGMDAHFHNPYGKFGKSIIHLFTHSVVWPKGRPQPIATQEDLKTTQVIVHENSYSHHLMKGIGCEHNAIPYKDMKKAVMELADGRDGQILWNTASLKSLLHMYHISNLQIAPVAMPDGEYKFMSNDDRLLARLDSAFNALDSEDRLIGLQNKWFYPEIHDTGIPSWIWNILNTAMVLVFVLGIYVILSVVRMRRAQAQGKKRTSRLALVMHTSGLSIWLFDIHEKLFTWLDHDGVASQQYPISQMETRVGTENLTRITACLEKLANGDCETTSLEVTTFAESNPTGGDRIYVIDFSVLRRKNGKPHIIIAVCTDVYNERQKQQASLEKLSRYRSVFDTALVDMIYYNKDGMIADMNERAQKTFRMTLMETIKHEIDLRRIMDMPELDYKKLDYFYATIFVTPDGHHCDPKAENAMVYELQLVPIHDANGELQCVYGTGRDITEAVSTYRALQNSIRQVEQTTEKVTDYVKNINYVMGVGGVSMANYSPQSHMLTIYRELDVVQQELTQTRCMMLVDKGSYKTALRLLNNMDNLTTQGVDAEIKTILKVHGKPLHLQLRFVPTFDESGHVNGYFGLCRDISELKLTEELLKKETIRAQEIEDLKNSFLRNMSYEIRTPLNAVVGFAELFEQEHAPEDEDIFIQEIKQNSAHLLNLINDILFLSRLDAHMIEQERQDTDFALTFDSHCQLGWANYQKEGVSYIAENRFLSMVVNIDDTNIGRIIEQLTANAAQHTESGEVRARYDYLNGQLVVGIEDTGTGMSKSTLEHVFERFASGTHQGTGLGLPICKELVEQMGGHIGITSEEHKGTSVWITIPATAVKIERKKEA